MWRGRGFEVAGLEGGGGRSFMWGGCLVGGGGVWMGLLELGGWVCRVCGGRWKLQCRITRSAAALAILAGDLMGSVRWIYTIASFTDELGPSVVQFDPVNVS